MCNSSANDDETDDDDDDAGCCRDGLIGEGFILADGIVVAAEAVRVDDCAVGVDAALILSENDSAALSVSLSLLASDDTDNCNELFVVLVVFAALSKFFFLDARASCSAKLILLFVDVIVAKALDVDI